ncbi:E3 ubiquitin-protein ligase TTC3 isoform 1-T1 [Pholidichthys leucotaenia]
MSDSDSDSDYDERMEARLNQFYSAGVAFQLAAELVENWISIPEDTRRQAIQQMKVLFWLPILLQRQPQPSTEWAISIGLIEAHTEDLTLKHLHRIETVDAILKSVDSGINEIWERQHVFINSIFDLAAAEEVGFKQLRSKGLPQKRALEIMDASLSWLFEVGESSLNARLEDHFHTREVYYIVFHHIYAEYAILIREMSSNKERAIKSLQSRRPETQLEKCEEMKNKGNENFKKERYEKAVEFYTKALQYYPDNYKIYGNRALCYIRCKNFLKAAGDAKRATLIKPTWAKGHYRYCEALFEMGEYQLATHANYVGQRQCKDNVEGIRDLEQLLRKVLHTAARPLLMSSPVKPKEFPQQFTVGVVRSIPQTGKAKGGRASSMPPKVLEAKKEKLTVKNLKSPQTEKTSKESKPSKSELPPKNVKVEPNPPAKKKPNKSDQTEEENQKPTDEKAVVVKEMKSLVEDAYAALADLRSRNAEQMFSRALALLETVTPKDLGFSTMDVILLLFGRASALTEIGQPEELAEAQKVLEKIKSYEERTFQCVVYYTFGKVHLKENRFSVALEQFLDSLQMVKNQITPGKLTWPLTKEIVKETQPDYFKESLESCIELCKFPSPPDAVCRLEKCSCSLKAEIYFTDPDFKGFIQICCCQQCTVEYHITCWKTMKLSVFSEKVEKDLLHEPCLTPDCVGQICSIKIIGPTGLMKCKFEVTIPKPQTLKKPRLKQMCTSLKKLTLKADRKLKRKQDKQYFQDKQPISEEILQQKEDSASQSQQKAWLLYRDRVLLQISQNIELLREEKDLVVSALTCSLKPWLELDLARGNELAGRLLNWEQDPLLTIGQAVELLLERQSRVWARVFIQHLSSSVNINPKLLSWACQLNDSGLDAAKTFIERYSEHLEQLDLTLVLKFGPLEEMILEKLSTRPEFFSRLGLTMTEYLRQAPPHDMRLFIWTLEEHREDYVSCHTLLDEYFDMMDGHCSVLKKSDESENNSPMRAKGRARKKKRKEPKGVFVLPGVRCSRDELDQDFFEDDPLSFLDPSEPFSVPYHLREQVADFEDQYNATGQRSHFRKILDNNPDPTKESLFDYFAQILEEHGPLVAEDPLLVGELENFPPEAKQKISNAGGFEQFLLESLRFIKMGTCIGLAQHAVSLQQAGHGATLDELDFIVDPDSDLETPDLYTADGTDFTSSLNGSIYAPSEAFFPILPNPYVYGIHSEGTEYIVWSNGDDLEPDSHLSSNVFDLDGLDALDDISEPETASVELTSLTSNATFLKRDAEVQTRKQALRSVAMNTELHEPFESCPGDINKTVKNSKMLEKQNHKMSAKKANQSKREDTALLEEDVQKITVNIQVTNKELMTLQQKLEEEVKKDQKEKKANQEVLKSLKLEIEELVEEQGSLARTIQEKKKSYEDRLNDFLELSNQSAAERMSLEDEIKRCTNLFNKATKRAHSAQVGIIENTHDHILSNLHKELSDAKALLAKLDEAAQRFPNQELDETRKSVRAKVDDVEKKISSTKQQYQAQLDQVKKGRKAAELLPVKVNNQSDAAAAKGRTLSAVAKDFSPKSAVEKPATQAHHKPVSVFDKAMESLGTMFPDYSRPELKKIIQEWRSSCSGHLSGMGLQDVVSGVADRILGAQDGLNNGRSNVFGLGGSAQCATPPLPPVWQTVGHQRAPNPNALNVEDPCIICHEDMGPEDTCVLECRHSFHKECIRSWLKEQSTCPTCRTHALLPDDFPVLATRRRQAP